MKRIVIIGGGHAGGQLIDVTRKLGFDGELILITEESVLPYQRPPLSKKYLAGELSRERLAFRPPAVFEKHAVDVRLETRVEAINRQDRRLSLADGSQLNYDMLALATGARVRRLPMPHDHLDGVHYLRTLADVDAIRAQLEAANNIVVIGGGFIGLEAAATLKSLGKRVTVLEMAGRLMARTVAPVIGRFFEQVHRDQGVDLELDAYVRALHGDNRVTEVECVDGSVHAADLVIIGIGVIPNDQLAESAGLACEDGILVDEFAATEDVAVFAAGDCTRHPNPLLGGMIRLESVHNALEQARTAAGSMLGQRSAYHQIPWFWSDQYSLKLQMAGLSEGHDHHHIHGAMTDGRFTVSYFSEGQLIALDTVNNPADHMAARKILNAGAKVGADQAARDDFSWSAFAQAL